MTRTPVSSSNLRSVGYDAQSSLLEIEFQDGHVYDYSRVGNATFSALMRALSKGTYFHDYIKDRYVCRRVARPVNRAGARTACAGARRVKPFLGAATSRTSAAYREASAR
jgi:hypothetical protein